MAEEASPAAAKTVSQEETVHQIRLFLDELIDAASQMMKIVRVRVDAQKADEVGAAGSLLDIAQAFDWGSEGLRCAIALSSCLVIPQPAVLTMTRASGRQRVMRMIEAGIRQLLPREDYGDEFEDWLIDLIGRPDLAELVPTLPMEEILAKICRDIGAAAREPAMRGWKRRVPSEIAVLCLRAARFPVAPIGIVAQTGRPDAPRSRFRPQGHIRLVHG